MLCGRDVNEHSILSKISLASSPYCCFRNIARYQQELVSSSNRSAKTYSKSLNSVASKRASDETFLYQDSIGRHHIPTGLLYETLYGEVQMAMDSNEKDNFYSVRDSLLSFSHNNRNDFLLQLSGKHLDEVTVRNINFLQPQYPYLFQPGFSLSLSRGAPIRQLLFAGHSRFGMVSNILACTSSEIYFLQSADAPSADKRTTNIVSKSLLKSTPESALYKKNQQDENELILCPLIQPKGKYQLPEVIINMDSCCAGSSIQATILGKDGGIYTWTPIRGVFRAAQASFQNPAGIAASTHPMISYLWSNNELYHCDLRSSNQCAFQTSFTDSISVVNQHMGVTNQYFVSSGEQLLLMDVRYNKAYISRSNCGTSFSSIEQKMTFDYDGNLTDLLLCRGADNGHSLKLHSIRRDDDQIHSLNLASPFLAKEAKSSWYVDSLPVIDKSQDCIGSQCLMIQPAPEPKYRIGSNRSKYLVPRFFAIIAQQSLIGDVYAQRVGWTEREKETEFVCKTNSSSEKGDSESETSGSDLEEEYEDDRDSDEDSGKDVKFDGIDRPKPVSANACGSASGKVDSQVLSCGLPPIQLALPCGNRCFNSRYIYRLQHGRRINFSLHPDLLISQRYMHKFYPPQPRILSRGLLLRPSLHSSDIKGKPCYPLPSSAFRKVIGEDCLIGRDAILVFPSDLRRDLPRLPRNPSFRTFIKKTEDISDLRQALDLLRDLFLDLSSNGQSLGAATLWEIWHLIWSKYDKKIEYVILCEALRRSENVAESFVPNRSQISVASMYSCFSDGSAVSDDSKSSNPNESDSAYNCMCDIAKLRNFSRVSHGVSGQKKAASRGSRQEKPIVGCGKVDCIVPHYLCYELRNEINAKRINSSDRSSNRSMQTDVTNDLIVSLLELWDEQAESAYAVWPEHCMPADTK